MLEKSVQERKGSYLFCDTDSLCIVASKKTGLLPCVGGDLKFRGKEAIKALSIRQVRAIAKRFNALNPYDTNYVKNLLKSEEINFAESDSSKSNPLLWGYAIAAKRYALYRKTEEGIEIVKASGHGLGYLFAPKENPAGDDEETQETQEAEDSDEATKLRNGLLKRGLG